MAIRVALHHKTSYQFDRLVNLSPHEVRLRPAAHARTPILSYSLTVNPKNHFINWQQDPYGNYIARFVFPEKVQELAFTVDLVADMTVINPFDFFVEKYAEHFPFKYTDQQMLELSAYLKPDPMGPLLQDWVAKIEKELVKQDLSTANFLVAVNQALQKEIGYLVRMEPGIQTPEETFNNKTGSCRDSAWLLVQICRNLGLAARFVSGYLIQLTADIEALDGPSGTKVDFTDLHAWTEVFVPGAGWIGLDPTSGLMAGEGHIPLACTALPSSAAPVTGLTDVAEVTFDHEMTITRIHEDPRVTKPYSENDWLKIDKLGKKVDNDLKKQDVRLTQGGEPTFVSIDDMEGAEWNTEAHGKKKRQLAGELALKLKQHFTKGSLLHYGQGKWYPGEPLPRWAINMFWRIDGKPIWRDESLFSNEKTNDKYTAKQALLFAKALTKQLDFPEACLIPAYEDVVALAHLEEQFPDNLDPLKADLNDSEERQRIARLLEGDLNEVVGYVMPIKPTKVKKHKKGKSKDNDVEWLTSKWPLKREHLYLLGGDSPMGLRLPLKSLPWVLPDEMEPDFVVDPFAEPEALTSDDIGVTVKVKHKKTKPSPREVIHTALCVEVRNGRLHVFMPPVERLDDYLILVRAVEDTAARLQLKLWLEGYTPPRDARIKMLSVTPEFEG